MLTKMMEIMGNKNIKPNQTSPQIPRRHFTPLPAELSEYSRQTRIEIPLKISQ